MVMEINMKFDKLKLECILNNCFALIASVFSAYQAYISESELYTIANFIVCVVLIMYFVNSTRINYLEEKIKILEERIDTKK